MAKILNVSELIDAGRILELEGLDAMEQKLIDAADELADAIAKKLGIEKGQTTSEELEMAGLCASFTGDDESKWPESLAHLDEGGELGE